MTKSPMILRVFLAAAVVLAAGGCATTTNLTAAMPRDALEALPKASPDADIVLQLESNKPKTVFLVDGKELVTGKRVKVLVNNQGHEVIARPEGFMEKEQYIQPPYSRAEHLTPRLSFYFLMEDRDPNFQAGFDSPELSGAAPAAPVAAPPVVAGNTPAIPLSALGQVTVLKPARAASQRRIALVIGNASYASSPLANPANDANAMSQVLTGQGFTVYLALNVDLKQMDQAVRLFGGELAKGSGVGLFYFAGHGVQVGGDNYLLPIGHNINAENDVKYQAVNVATVLDQMGQASNGLNIVVLDACRDNPLPKSWSRSSTRGLSRINNSPQGTFIAFATEPGNVAQDGGDGNGLFTKHLISAMKTPGRELELVFKDVLRGVKSESQGKQVPWSSSSFYGEFRFAEAP